MTACCDNCIFLTLETNSIMKKSIFIIFALLFVCFCANAQISRSEYIKKYQSLAIEEMHRSGIPASITMAQACLESGNGNSELSRKSNNHFGIKCKSTWKGKKVYYDDDEKDECFRKYVICVCFTYISKPGVQGQIFRQIKPAPQGYLMFCKSIVDF